MGKSNPELERRIKYYNTKDDSLNVNEVFRFLTFHNVVINAICIDCTCDKTICNGGAISKDRTLLCYSQNKLFYVHEVYNLESAEYLILDFNQPLVEDCVISEYDKKLAEYAK